MTNTPVLGQTQASAQPAPSGPAQPSLSADRASTKTASKSGEVTPDHSAVSDPCEDANSTNGRKLLTRVLAETPYNLNELAAWAQSKDWFRTMPPEVRIWPVEDLGCLVTKLGGLVSTAPPASVTPMAQTPLAPAVNAQASARVRIPEPARFNGENCTPRSVRSWLKDVQLAVRQMGLADPVLYAVTLLQGRAATWREISLDVQFPGLGNIPWSEFETAMMAKFVPASVQLQAFRSFEKLSATGYC